jgi:hypothetical protein
MPVLILKALECISTEDYTGADTCRLEISVDGASPSKMTKDLNTMERWILDKSFAFTNQVSIKLWDEDWPDPDDYLGRIEIKPDLVHRTQGKFGKSGAEYILWYEVIDPVVAHRLTHISLRQMLGRLGRGVLTEKEYQELIGSALLYQCSQVISVRDTFQSHAAQDGVKSNTNSVKTWIDLHCNPWGEESVIPISMIPRAWRWYEVARGKPNWVAVKDERSYRVSGLQHSSYPARTDNPISHETMDWCWNQILDPQYTYLLDYTTNRKELTGGLKFPYIHNEIEGGSLPIQWRPFCGEYVTTSGRHVHDLGHLPVKAEIHPGSTIIREHTTAAPLGNGEAMVPANQAIIGMGLSGGFPGDVGSRWNDETGGIPNGISGDTTDCWVTNLKKHTLRFKLYPPVPQPSQTAQLKWRVVLCEYIQTSSWDKVDGFLELCQQDDPADGDLGFRVWDRNRRLPQGFTPREAPVALQPKITLKHNSWLDVEIDLNPATGIPVGYYAVIECGWSEKGPHTLQGFDVTFQTIKAISTSSWEHWDDWHIYYGVNGQWAAWWTDDFITEGDTYTQNKKFTIYTVDDMPISIRDCGIEWEGMDFGNDHLDRISITARGPDYFGRILENKSSNVTVISRDGNALKFKVQGEQGRGQTKHEWTIEIVRFL